MVIDIGGGSTEIITGKTHEQPVAKSLPIGGVVLTEEYIYHDPPLKTEIGAMKWDTAVKIYSLPMIEGECRATGVGGTITTLAAVHHGLTEYTPDVIENTMLSGDDVASILERFSQCTVEERAAIPGMEKGREDIILAGTVILFECMRYYSLKTIRVSTKGVRYGYLMSLTSENT